jgi:hypothetical protein
MTSRSSNFDLWVRVSVLKRYPIVIVAIADRLGALVAKHLDS